MRQTTSYWMRTSCLTQQISNGVITFFLKTRQTIMEAILRIKCLQKWIPNKDHVFYHDPSSAFYVFIHDHQEDLRC